MFILILQLIQARPSKKRITLDMTSTNSDTVRELNSLFPKIDNLEYFPLKILLKIFVSVDDIGLLYLAKNSTRLESIVKVVLNERYSTEYFFVDDSKIRSQTCQDFLRLFGSEIKSIEAQTYRIDAQNHWIASILNRTDNLEKLKLDSYYIDDNKHEHILQQYAKSNITHLSLGKRAGNTEKGFVLSKFCILKKF